MKNEIEKIKGFLKAYGYGNEFNNVSDDSFHGRDYVDPPPLPQPLTPFKYSPATVLPPGPIVPFGPVAPPHPAVVSSGPVAPPRPIVPFGPVAPPHPVVVSSGPVAPPGPIVSFGGPVAPPHPAVVFSGPVAPRGPIVPLGGPVAPPQAEPVAPPGQSGPPTAPSHCSIPALDLSKIRRKSCSRGNFAKNLLAKIIPEEEWIKSNVHGKRGKEAISPHIVNYVKQCSFYMYPLESNESMEQAWGFCVRSMDTGARQLREGSDLSIKTVYCDYLIPCIRFYKNRNTDEQP